MTLYVVSLSFLWARSQQQKRGRGPGRNRVTLPENRKYDRNRIMAKQLSCNLIQLLRYWLLLLWQFLQLVIDENLNNSKIIVFRYRRHVIA